jgi:hypothetical protein
MSYVPLAKARPLRKCFVQCRTSLNARTSPRSVNASGARSAGDIGSRLQRSRHAYPRPSALFSGCR